MNQIIEQKNILDVKTCGVICHQVNCRGEGKLDGGLAGQIFDKWHWARDSYGFKTDWRPGDCQIVEVNHQDSVYVANLAGQIQPGNSLTFIGDLANALRTARDFAEANCFTLYIPYGMGCGIADGNWETVSRIIYDIAPNAIICKLPN